MDPIPHVVPKIVGRHYRIESRVGIGGMGVVYRATDTNLNRPVAVKAIHEARYRDRDGRNRLREEAMAAASIDHPYICKVYELIEEANEAYLVMEFVEGETLTARLRRGIPSLAETVQIASEVVEGLATAHARGLVHRDVKPSNVMITKTGHVKLLDFGLAREDVIAMPTDRTRTSPSDASAYAGTPQYMSPEQAEGLPVTARADLFSVGVLIFESLTGKLPFAGTSAYDYVRHLLSDNPRRLDRLAPEAPADLVRIVERCLEKAPADRPASAGEVLEVLRTISGSLSSTGRPFNTASDARAKRRWQLVAGAIGLAALSLGTWQWFLGGPGVDPLRRSRSVVTWPSEEANSRVSPDGRWVSFISNRDGVTQLYVLSADGTEARPVTLPGGRVTSHAWSPDGDRLAAVLRRPDGLVIQVVPAFFGGAALTTIPVDATSVRALRWIGRRLFVEAASDGGRFLQVADLDAGTVTNLSADWAIEGRLLDVDVRPDGREAVVSVQHEGRSDLWTTPIDAWRPSRRTDDDFYALNPVWSGRGDAIIYSTNRGGQHDLWELTLADGRMRSLTSSQTEERAGGTSADGDVVSFEQNSDDARLWFLDPAVPVARQLTADALSDLAPMLSADGTRVVFQRSRPSPTQGFQILDAHLFLAEVTAGAFRGEPRLAADGFAGVLSPDGRRLAYAQSGDEAGRTVLFAKTLDTDDTAVVSRAARLQVLRPYPVDWAERLVTWNRAGDALYFVDNEGADAVRRYRIGQATADDPLFTTAPGSYARDLHLSADGASLSFLAWTGGGFDLHAIDIPSGRDEVIAQVAGRFTGVFGHGWLPDGRVVLTRSGATHEDNSTDVEVLVVSRSGSVNVRGVVPRAFDATARLDPRSRVVYMTGTEQGIHNLYAMSLGDGLTRRVTDNALQGVTFSGIVPVPTGGLIVVQSQRKRDVWVIETTPQRDDR